MMCKQKIQLFLLLASLTLGGCATTSHNPKDPFESLNRGTYQLNSALDKIVAKPLAKGYNTVIPAQGRTVLSNFFSNLDDVDVALNDLLQFKIVQAVSDVGRVVVNSTVGLLGIVDVATPMGLKKHNEDFGQTLGRWGVGSGPYIMLPVLGSSSVRDGVGLWADGRVSMFRKIRNVPTRNQIYAVKLLGERAELLDQENMLNEAAIDRYAFIRDAYLQRRQSMVYDGNPPREKFDDEEDNSKPDKSSSSNKVEDTQPAAAEAPPVAAPAVVAVTSEPSAAAQQTPGIQRIWVSGNAGVH